MKRKLDSSNTKRERTVRFRVSLDEVKSLQDQAKKQRMTLSEYIRQRLGKQRRFSDRRDYIRLLAEMGKQGSNLNQLVKAMNIWVRSCKHPYIDPNILHHSITNINLLTIELLKILRHGDSRKN